MEYYIRQNCRLCGHKSLEEVLRLRDSPLCDAYLKEPKKQKFYPLGLNRCKKCDFVQIDTVVDPGIIYRDYIYITTSSSGLNKHFSEYSDYICKYLSIDKGGLAVDIGSNDGTLLGFFQKKNLRVVGVEPSLETAERANMEGILTYPDFFDKELAQTITGVHGQADLITVNNLFANIDDLHTFLQAVDILLSSTGVLVVESSYLVKMIDNVVFDFIYHEHLSYLSALPFQAFLRNFDMHFIFCQEVPTKGGSLRYYIARANSGRKVEASVQQLLDKEYSKNQLRQAFQGYAVKIEEERRKTRTFLQESKNKRIVGYGASATSTTLISHFGLQEFLTYLVDDNPCKIGTFSPGYHIPVYAFDRIMEEPPDIVVILAWRFRKEIICKLRELPCTIIVPLRDFELIQ